MVKMSYQIHRDTLLDPAFAVLPTDENPGITAVILSDDRIGETDDHGIDLLLIFLQGLFDRSTMPDLLLLYGRGVLLLDKEHPAFGILEKLADCDIRIKACTESLSFYNKEPAVSKIQPVPMSVITQDMLKADRIIRP